MASIKNIQQVNHLSTEIDKTYGLVFLNYQGLKHGDIEDLRNEVEKIGCKVHISKNSLLAIALRQTKHQAVIDLVKKYIEPTATLYLGNEYIPALKSLKTFIKSHELPVVKGGILENRVLSGEDILRIAELPTKDILYAQLLGQLNVPVSSLARVLQANIHNLVYALSAISKSKGGE